MRNLKKILALVLALVMSLSLVTIANASDFTDADDITYEEAADVMSTIGVIEGYEDGSFDPDGTLVREEATKLVTFMLLGDNANNLGIERSSFNDVAMTRWSAPAIEYCVSLGIIDGAGDGNFSPRGQLTAVAFAKVLLTALGYDADTEGLVGATWSVNTAALAMEVGLDNGIEDLSWNAALTREEAAQMALNAIQAPLVAYEGGVTVVVGDTPVSFGSGDAYYITTTLAREQRISDERLSNSDDYTVEFGERYFPRLRLNTETDEFERPSHTWVYENTELGTYVDYDLLVETYTEGVDGRTLYELLSRSTIEKYSLTYYVDGVKTTLEKDKLVRSNTSNVGQTGNGVLTQVFVDHDNEEIVITSIHTYLAQANGDYNEKSETVSLKVFDQVTDGTTGDTQIIDAAEVPNIVDIVKDQYVLVNMSGKDSGTAADLEVVKVSDVEILTDTDVTEFSTDRDSDKIPSIFDSLTADGEDYSSSYKAFYNVDALNLYDNALLTNTSYNVYLDQYGYAIGVDLYSGELNYVFITGYDRPESNISVRTAQAAAIFLDGSMKEITVNVTATTKNLEDRNNANLVDADYDGKYEFWKGEGEYDLNRWFSYTETDGVYTLRPVDEGKMLITDYAAEIVDADDTKTINCSNVWVSDNADYSGTPDNMNPTPTNKRGFGNDDSIYITVEPGKVDTSANNAAITDVTGLYTGVQNVEIEMSLDTRKNVDYYVYTLIDDDQYIIASIVLGEAQGSTANYAFITDAPTAERIDRETNTYYWSFDAIMGGKKVTLWARSKYQNTVNELVRGLNSVVELRFDGDYVTNVKLLGKDVTDFNEAIKDGDEVFDVDTTITPYNGAAVELYLSGRTLHTGDQSKGLTFVTDAPTVLRQQINEKWTSTEYDSVEEAYNDLADADPSDGTLDFKGRIVAVLNSQGVAEWVYIYSLTPVTSGNQGGITTPGVQVTIDSSNNIKVTTTDKHITTEEALENIIAHLEGMGLTVGTPRLIDGGLSPDYYDIPTFYTVGDIQIPATTYRFTLNGTYFVQNVTISVNGVSDTVRYGTTLASHFSTGCMYVEYNGNRVKVSDLGTATVTSGTSYTTYSEVKNAAGVIKIGVVGTKVVDAYPGFLEGNYFSDGKPVADYKFPAATSETVVDDGYYKVDKYGTVTYQKPGAVAISADHALVNDVLTAAADVKVVDKDLVIKDYYYERTFTATLDDFKNTSIGDMTVVSGNAVIQDGKIYGQDGAKIEVTVTTTAPGFIAGTSCKLTGSIGVAIADHYTTNGTILGGGSNELTFSSGSTNYGTATVTITLTSGETAYTLTDTNS